MLRDDGSYEVWAATLNNEGVLRSEFTNAYPEDIPEYKLSSFYDVNFLQQVRRFARYLNENRIDLIHTHDFYTNVFGMSAATLAGTPARVASKRESGGMRSRSQDLVEKISFGRANAILVNSEAVINHLAQRNLPVAKMRLIYNGTDISRFDRKPDENALDKYGLPTVEKIPFVTMVANLRHRVKNVPMLLRTAKRVLSVCPNAHFVIAGEGELEPELRAMAGELGVADTVHFIGRCDDVPTLLAASYACVLTSDAEGFSNSLIEYMAAGKPVVATAVGGAAETIVEGVTGFIVSPNDDAAMAKHLINLLSDETAAKKMGDSGKITAIECFSLSSQRSKILELYKDCLTK